MVGHFGLKNAGISPIEEPMKTSLQRVIVGALLAATFATAVGCTAYPPPPPQQAYTDAKGYEVPRGPAPAYGAQPMGVDPGLAVAGAAAAGLLGYALGNNNHNHYYHGPYYGPRYYGPVPYRRGYYGPRYHR